jgi:hypothetical protein
MTKQIPVTVLEEAAIGVVVHTELKYEEQQVASILVRD